LYRECLAGAQIIFPESGRGLGDVTPTIFGSTVGYPSDSLASCFLMGARSEPMIKLRSNFNDLLTNLAGKYLRMRPHFPSAYPRAVVEEHEWAKLLECQLLEEMTLTFV